MSLDWSAKNVENWQEKDVVAGGGWCKVVTFECMAVDLNGPTEKNIEEFLNRSAFWRKVNGHDLIPEARIRDFIGLHTNVSDVVRSKWLKRVWENHERDRRWMRRNFNEEVSNG